MAMYKLKDCTQLVMLVICDSWYLDFELLSSGDLAIVQPFQQTGHPGCVLPARLELEGSPHQYMREWLPFLMVSGQWKGYCDLAQG